MLACCYLLSVGFEATKRNIAEKPTGIGLPYGISLACTNYGIHYIEAHLDTLIVNLTYITETTKTGPTRQF
jgi:hypothetical protein